MIKVFVQGAFEIINAGHCEVFRYCRKQGDHLTVGLNTNELLESYKGRSAVLPWNEKKLIIQSIRYVDEVVEAPQFSPIQLLEALDIDVYCIALEWKDTKDEEIAYMLSHDKRIVFVPDFGMTRTSTIKERLLAETLARV